MLARCRVLMRARCFGRERGHKRDRESAPATHHSICYRKARIHAMHVKVSRSKPLNTRSFELEQVGAQDWTTIDHMMCVIIQGVHHIIWGSSTHTPLYSKTYSIFVNNHTHASERDTSRPAQHTAYGFSHTPSTHFFFAATPPSTTPRT